jgi:hypothetical protein
VPTLQRDDRYSLGPDAKGGRVVTDLVSLVRHALRPSDPLTPFPEVVRQRYAAWLKQQADAGAMGRSLSRAANYIGKIHAAALMSASTEVEVYPVIDGCYMITEKRPALEDALTGAMERLASVFVHEKTIDKRFLVRGGIAAGRIIAGRDLAACSDQLKKNKSYANCLAIGTAIGQAYAAESSAPPYGFWVDITARAFKEGKSHPFTTTLWRWWSPASAEGRLRQEVLGAAVEEYFAWAEKNRRSIEYPPERLKEHRDAAREYFSWEPDGD